MEEETDESIAQNDHWNINSNNGRNEHLNIFVWYFVNVFLKARLIRKYTNESSCAVLRCIKIFCLFRVRVSDRNFMS